MRPMKPSASGGQPPRIPTIVQSRAQERDCRYAVQVAADIQREADALAKAFSELGRAAARPSRRNPGPAMSELVNQWTGALERLRWAEMEKPRLAGSAQGGRNAAAYARGASGQTAARWAAQWQALRTLGASPAQATEAPRPGAGLAPIETYLRGLGRNEPADLLAQSVGKADKALQNLAREQGRHHRRRALTGRPEKTRRGRDRARAGGQHRLSGRRRRLRKSATTERA